MLSNFAMVNRPADGQEITWEQFGHMLMTSEEWQFKLEILDKSEEPSLRSTCFQQLAPDPVNHRWPVVRGE